MRTLIILEMQLYSFFLGVRSVCVVRGAAFMHFWAVCYYSMYCNYCHQCAVFLLKKWSQAKWESYTYNEKATVMIIEWNGEKCSKWIVC